MNRDMVLVTFEGRFFKTKGIFGKMPMLDRASLSVKKKFSRGITKVTFPMCHPKGEQASSHSSVIFDAKKP